MAKQLKLSEIAARINAHLRRFEADPAINARDKTWNVKPYYCACAFRAGRYVGIRYVSYQHTWNMTREEAVRYLSALDSGFVGAHFSLDRLPTAGSEGG